MPRFGAIILAAGMSSRMGSFKILLPWYDDKPILHHVLKKYITLEINPIIIVMGRDEADVKQAISDFPVTCVHNPDYETGEILSSVKVGLRAMPADVTATFINPGDMPRIPQRIIEMMQETYQSGHIVAPRYDGQRGHPILLDKSFWYEMLNLPDDGAPRDVIKAHSSKLLFIETDDEGVVVDIDTPEIYEQELKRYL